MQILSKTSSFLDLWFFLFQLQYVWWNSRWHCSKIITNVVKASHVMSVPERGEISIIPFSEIWPRRDKQEGNISSILGSSSLRLSLAAVTYIRQQMALKSSCGCCPFPTMSPTRLKGREAHFPSKRHIFCVLKPYVLYIRSYYHSSSCSYMVCVLL